MKYIYWILTSIFFIGVVLRFYQLGSIPNSLNWDEVSWGYNAYSIATTGRDEYGSFLPLSFRAFGDYKQPMYVYLDALPMQLFGFSGFAVRFPSAFFGCLSILSVFFLVRELFAKEKRRDILALLVALLFAISPWSIQFSRVAFEANVGVFFTITGVGLFLFGRNREKVWAMVLGTIIASLSCYTYHSQKLFTPILFIGLLLFSYQFLKKQKRIIVVLLFVFLLANLPWIIDGRTTARGRSVVFTSAQTEILKDSTKELIADTTNHSLFGQALHNRRVVYLNTYLTNYLNHFSPNWLFIKGDNPRHHPPGMGILYIVSLPFILIGMVLLLKKYQSESIFIYYWLLLAPAASALTVDTPNASRRMVFLPTWQIFTALGIYSVYHFFRHKIVRIIVTSAISLLYLGNFMYYASWYYGHTNSEYAAYWQYGYREAIQKIPADKRVFFASDMEQPYIFYLFYKHIQPSEYLQTGGSQRIWSSCFTIRNAFFGKCEGKMQTGDIVISSKEKVGQQHLAKLDEIHYPNDEVAVRIFSVK